LTDFYETVAAIRLLTKEGLTVEFHPSTAWNEVRRWLDLAGVRWNMPNGARVTRGLRARLIRSESSLERLKWVGILALLPAWVLLGVRRIVWSPPPPQFVQVGLRAYTTDWNFFGEGSREIGWLLNNRQVHRENTLFVIEKPLSSEYRDEFERRRYRCVDISGENAFRRLSVRFLVRELLGRGLKAWARLLVAETRAPGLFLEVAARGWLEYFRWSAFLERWHPRHYVVYNHFHFDHMFRNSRLRSAGCASWYYVHSVHDRCAYYDGLPERAIRCQEGLTYLGYDHEVHWGKRDEKLYRQMHGGTRAYHVWGPLWSAHVWPVRSVTEQVERLRSEMKIDAIVAVFDTSFGSASPYGADGAREFYDTLAEMLDRPNWACRLLLFKSKNNEDEFQDSPETAESLGRLLKHPRCLSLDADMAPGVAIAEADLTVSIAYTSTTVEALGARRRAFYFDPGGKFRASYYERFPDLVAHDRETLAHLCEYWLGLPEADFQKYLDERLAPEFGGYLDGGAVARFREALACE
jgi:polysaccharide biosynthesis PFTS motif protein